MGLATYKSKRKFTQTPEPSGSTKKIGSERSRSNKNQLVFVVQKHHASHLHYDFRLEMKGTLKSWAVPKGPSMNPEDKRLAMLVEDHPFDYKDFEGVIPEGNYGAGTVIIWDQGTYAPAEKFKTKEETEKYLLKGFYSGKLSIVMKGKKLKGEFSLVRASQRGDNSWLLMKKADAEASTFDITKKDKSVVSKKNLEQVAKDRHAKKWISNRQTNGVQKETGKIWKAKKTTVTSTPQLLGGEEDITQILADHPAKKRKSFPKDLSPMLATLTDAPFDEPGWIYEVKWDGYRALGYLNGEKSTLRSRNNKTFDEQFYPVKKAIQSWPVKAVVDGEIVVVNEKGISSFSALQQWRSEADGELLYYVFDILWLEGFDLTQLSLLERREILRKIMSQEGLCKFSENMEADVHEFFKLAEKLGMEGIIAKKANSVYEAGERTRQWLKIKTGHQHEAVIAGYTVNEGSNKLFSALLLGVYDKEELRFIGQVGTGFTVKLQEEILALLQPLETKKAPFKNIPEINKPSRFRPHPPKAEVHWVKPQLACEVKYTELTGDGIMRHPSFQGMREDKKAKEIVLEKPVETPGKNTKMKPGKNADKILSPPKGKERKDFLNPYDESQTRKIEGHDLSFSNLSKLYWPKEKISKRDMLNYYYRIAPFILPFMKDRPQSMNRFPHGILGENFYQKNVKGKVPSWMTTHDYKNTTKDGEKTFLVCTNEATLLYMANLGCIEMNPWHSRVQSPDKPDWCVIDLDPDDGNSFEQVIEVAQVVKNVLEQMKLPSFPKTSGSTGMHIYIPLGAKYSYEQSKQLAHLVVSMVYPEVSSFTSLERSPARRKGLIYLDYLQNRAIQTIAAPYSLRPKPGATVSTPLHWDEVKKGLRISNFNIYNIEGRLKEMGDIFKGVLGKGVDMAKAIAKIE